MLGEKQKEASEASVLYQAIEKMAELGHHLPLPSAGPEMATQ